jgi:hypothetical protein
MSSDGVVQYLDYKTMKKPAITLAFGWCWMILDEAMVEAAGVRLCTGIENT